MKHKNLFESIVSLTILNGLNLLLPLITLPYTIRVVGYANYGAYSIVYSIIQYVLMVSAYGFAYSSTQQIAQCREDIQKVSTIFNATIVARFVLSIVPIILLGGVSFFVYNEKYFLMYLLGLGIVIGDNLNPVWLFQGMEKMRYMTIVNVICKLAFTILIFVLIKQEDDYIYLTLLNSLGYVLSGVISLIIAKYSFKVCFLIPKWKDVEYQLKEGWYIFLSTVCMSVYRSSNVFILSFFVPEAAVGMYSGAEKMVKAAQAVASPITNAFYPYFANAKDPDNPKSILPGIIKLTKVMSIILLGISLVAFFGADLLNRLFLDPNTPETAFLIQLMIPVIFFGSLNYILGIVGLVNMDMKKEFFRYVMISGIASLVFLFATVYFWGNISACLAMSISEILLFGLCVYKLRSIK